MKKRNLLKMHAGILVGLGLINFAGLVIADSGSKEPVKKLEISAIEKSSRSPASIPSTSDVFSLNSICEFKGSEGSKTLREFIELDGVHCLKKKISKLKISNETNGYVASIFEMSQDKFKTDLIKLNPGMNSIAITGFDSNNKKIITYFKIDRQ